MDEEEPRSFTRTLIVIAFLIGVGVLLVSYGVTYNDLFVVMFLAYFFLSALFLRKGSRGQRPSRKEYEGDDEWGFDMGDKRPKEKDDDWGFEFGSDGDDEYHSLIKEKPVERDPYSDEGYQ